MDALMVKFTFSIGIIVGPAVESGETISSTHKKHIAINILENPVIILSISTFSVVTKYKISGGLPINKFSRFIG